MGIKKTLVFKSSHLTRYFCSQQKSRRKGWIEKWFLAKFNHWKFEKILCHLTSFFLEQIRKQVSTCNLKILKIWIFRSDPVVTIASVRDIIPLVAKWYVQNRPWSFVEAVKPHCQHCQRHKCKSLCSARACPCTWRTRTVTTPTTTPSTALSPRPSI